MTLPRFHRLHYAVLLILLAGVAEQCHPPATIVTQPGKDAYAADQVILRFTEASNFVQANTGTAPGNIKPADAFTIIEWISGDAHATPPTTGLVQIIQAIPGQGWKAAAKATWTTRIKPIFLSYPKLAPFAETIDALLEVV